MAGSTFIFAGGGTGGHLYPAFAIADAVRVVAPESQFHFICSDKPLDAAILTRRDVSFTPIPARPFAATPRGAARLAWRWGSCVRACRKVLSESQRAQGGGVTLVALGGYVAAPAAQAARVQRVPIALVNLDAAPGLANRWISRRASLCGVVGEASLAARSEIVRLRPIVRAGAIAKDTAAACRTRLGLDESAPVLFVTGGSLGASSINAFMERWCETPSESLANWQVLHQSGGAAWSDRLRLAYQRAGVRAVMAETIDDMAAAWGAADLAIARAGAGAVGEVWANAVPTVFVPYPHHKDQHQRRNAAPLVAAGGAVVVDDAVDPDANLQSAGDIAQDLMRDDAGREAMRSSLRTLPAADGAMVFAHVLCGDGRDGAD